MNLVDRTGMQVCLGKHRAKSKGVDTGRGQGQGRGNIVLKIDCRKPPIL